MTAIYMRWTGHGYLTPALVILIFCAGIYGGVVLARDDGVFAVLLVGMGLTALLSPLHWLLGLALNSERTPSGRRWHNRHTYFGAPVQYGFVAQLLIALTFAALAVGKETAPLYGWLLFGGTLVMGLIVAIKLDWQRLLRSVADRKELAAQLGWLYEDKNSNLGLRWQDLFGKQAAILMNPFGILAGEVEGFPFTAFDSEQAEPKTRRKQWRQQTRRTYWAIHLPVEYPRVSVHQTFPKVAFDALFSALKENRAPKDDPFSEFKKPPTPDNLGAKTADAVFGQALLTPQVRSTTVEFGLIGWRIEGRDLLFEQRVARPLSASEVVQVAGHLARLARQFPGDLAERFGSPPSTDIPLRKQAGTAQKRK